jgi:hypothetical protein
LSGRAESLPRASNRNVQQVSDICDILMEVPIPLGRLGPVDCPSRLYQSKL